MTVIRTPDVSRGWVVSMAAVVLAGLLGCDGSGGASTKVSVTGVSLDRPSLELTLGGVPVALVATVEPADATNTSVTWFSSNSSIATVTPAGVVTAVAPGSAIITATTQDGAKKATCTVTVVQGVITVTSLSLDKATLDLVTGAAPVKLNATITPSTATNKMLRWLSDKPAVATVSDAGEVTPISPGIAVISVKTADGSKAATCTVRVTAGATAVTGVSLNKSSLSLTVKSVAPALVATIAPASATNKELLWSSNNTEVATVDQLGVVTGKAVGNATITVTTKDGSFKATCAVTVTAPLNPVTGVTLKWPSLALAVGGYEVLLTATVTPANADNKAVLWTSTDESVAKVSDTGAVTPVGSGTATVTATTVEGSFTANCSVTVSPDAVGEVKAAAGWTGQVVLTWRDPADLNATGVEVTLLGAGGPTKRTVPVGKKTVAFAGLAIGAEQSFELRVLGAEGAASAVVGVKGTAQKVVKLLRFNSTTDPLYVTDTFGSARTATGDVVESHDVVFAKRADLESTDPKERYFPVNYRWVFMPGLADPTDPQLVSLKNAEYVKATPDGGMTACDHGTRSECQWAETERYLRVRADPMSDVGQWNAWCQDAADGKGFAFLVPAAFADLRESGGGVFNTEATFRALSRPAGWDAGVPGGTYFQWLGDATGNSYLVDVCYHILAQTADYVNRTGNNRPERFLGDTAWLIEDAGVLSP